MREGDLFVDPSILQNSRPEVCPRRRRDADRKLAVWHKSGLDGSFKTARMSELRVERRSSFRRLVL
ncbi:hypothetical protein B0H12DRAFT_1123825 [Mycena haematopus]|nr:hypothetical protein B0H12DRAFT_1123825 [Mycena haematopus]